jgi:hypothetical protein
MGVPLSLIEQLQELDLFGDGKVSILDIGSSNLYVAPVDRLESFLRANHATDAAKDTAFLKRLSYGSEYDQVTGGRNESFIGQLFEKAGMRYEAIDIADGFRTTILDLNHGRTPRKFVRRFDLVINSGTTEHLLNQYNAFRVMHEAAKVGAHIVHVLPCRGYSNHGYLTYTPRFFFDLAGYNGYEIVSFWFSGQGAEDDIYQPLRDYASYFPAISRFVSTTDTSLNQKTRDLTIAIVFKKISRARFKAPLERSTSVGLIPNIFSFYELGDAARRALSKIATRFGR